MFVETDLFSVGPEPLCSHLSDKLCGGIAECLQHGRGLSVEQRHLVSHLIVDFILNVQLQ